MKNLRSLTLTAVAAIAAGTVPAFAHVGVPGHEHGGLLAGLSHPVGGLDHLLAMLAVGIWSAITAQGQKSKLWIAPVAFVVAMLVGAGAGYVQLPLPMVETGIALSVLLLGLLIAARVELSALTGAALIALFAVYHGHAHGAEASGAIAAYMAGFAITTASLHIAGIGIGSAILRLKLAAPVIGGMIAATGAGLLAS